MKLKSAARLHLMGPARLETADGTIVKLSSKKTIALLAVLASSPRFERSRVWLQQLLWGSRATRQAQSSLRREISNLKSVLTLYDLDLIETTRHVVSLKKDQIDVDIYDTSARLDGVEFCEGLDLAGEEGFEDWLRGQRMLYVSDGVNPNKTQDVAPKPSEPVVHQAKLALAHTDHHDYTPRIATLAKTIESELYNGMAKMRWLPLADSVDASVIKAAYPMKEDDYRISAARYIIKLNIHEIDDGTHDAGGIAKVTFTLLEMPGSLVRWTDTRYIPENLEDHEFQTEISRAINCIASTFELCEQHRAADPIQHRSHDLLQKILRIRFNIDQFKKKSFERAALLLNEVAEKYPESRELLIAKIEFSHWLHWAQRSDPIELSKLAPMVRAFIRADPADARGPLYSGILDVWQKRNVQAQRNLIKACKMNASLADAFALLGASYCMSGQPAKAIRPLKYALDIAPLNAKKFINQGHFCIALWMNEEYERSLEVSRSVQLADPAFTLAKVMEVANCVALGKIAEARQAQAKLKADGRDRCIKLISWIPFESREWPEKLVAAIEGTK